MKTFSHLKLFTFMCLFISGAAFSDYTCPQSIKLDSSKTVFLHNEEVHSEIPALYFSNHHDLGGATRSLDMPTQGEYDITICYYDAAETTKIQGDRRKSIFERQCNDLNTSYSIEGGKWMHRKELQFPTLEHYCTAVFFNSNSHMVFIQIQADEHLKRY